MSRILTNIDGYIKLNEAHTRSLNTINPSIDDINELFNSDDRIRLVHFYSKIKLHIDKINRLELYIIYSLDMPHANIIIIKNIQLPHSSFCILNDNNYVYNLKHHTLPLFYMQNYDIKFKIQFSNLIELIRFKDQAITTDSYAISQSEYDILINKPHMFTDAKLFISHRRLND